MYLGIDLGTSGVKAVVLDDDQRIVAQATAPLSVSRPADLWSEQDPADWIKATKTVLDSLAVNGGLEKVQGIGLSGQMHGATLLEASDDVIRPAVLWNDTRSHAEAGALDSDPRFRELTGNVVFPGFTAPKLAWLRTHEPAAFADIATVLLPKDYLRLWLTGERVSEMSDAAGTAWLDMQKRDWSQPLLAATGLRREHMPRLVEGTEPSGGLRESLAARWSMKPGLPVAGGAGDNAATAIGVGVVGEGDGFVSLGTSGVLFAATEGYRPNAASAVHTFCHALPNTWHQMGVILSAASALDWFAGITGHPAKALTDALGADLRGPGQVRFLPYLSGERTPHNDPHLVGSFDGMTHATDRAAMTHAVLEGVAFALAENLDALEAAGTRLSSILAVGGGSRSRYWLELIATILGVEIKRPADGDFGAAFGAARLGMMTTGAKATDVLTPPAISETIAPNEALRASYQDARSGFAARRTAQLSVRGSR
ncbi:xylulokinase [Maritimibacter alexandrii]|uniref:xylulokinase n=1 Tax=Maritimibacter alexandrii TaxID=2570355 RepID=UPI001108D1B9|nr:xylulokinase [Maritimibacter alexandrii]